MIKPLLITFILLFTFKGLSQSIEDTVEHARQLAFQNKFTDAFQLLEVYNEHNPGQHSLHLQAQVLYWMNEVEKAKALYQKTILQYPDAIPLRMDYTRLLFEAGKYSAARQAAERIISWDRVHLEANLILLNLELMAGNFQKVHNRLPALLETYPENEQLLSLQHQTRVHYAPIVGIGYRFDRDNQPLTGHQLELSTQISRSQWFSPFIQFEEDYFFYDGASAAFHFSAGNTFYFNYGRSILRMEGGYFKNDGFQSLTGKAAFQQKLREILSADIVFGKQPYQNTTASIGSPLTYRFFEGRLSMNVKDKYLAQTAWHRDFFDDGNRIKNAYLWGVFPLLFKNTLKIWSGYAFSYADADQSTFRSTSTVDELLTTQSDFTDLHGIYDPYFTPEDQYNHSLIATIEVNLPADLTWQARASMGIYAHARQPVLYLDETSDGEFFINNSDYQERYHPFKLSTTTKYILNNSIIFEGKISYSKLLFYSRFSGAIRITYRFLK